MLWKVWLQYSTIPNVTALKVDCTSYSYYCSLYTERKQIVFGNGYTHTKGSFLSLKRKVVHLFCRRRGLLKKERGEGEGGKVYEKHLEFQTREREVKALSKKWKEEEEEEEEEEVFGAATGDGNHWRREREKVVEKWMDRGGGESRALNGEELMRRMWE